MARTDVLGPMAALFTEVLAPVSGRPGAMGKLAVLDMEQHSMSSAAQAACAKSAPLVSGTGSLGYVLASSTGSLRVPVCGCWLNAVAACWPMFGSGQRFETLYSLVNNCHMSDMPCCR